MVAQGFVRELIECGTGLGYPGLGALMFVNTLVGFPPSEVVCLVFGAVAADGGLDFGYVVLIATCSNTLGTFILFFLARWKGKEFIIRLRQSIHGRGASVLGICGYGHRATRLVEELFCSHGTLVVFLGRNVPLIRSVISIPAGLSSLSTHVFLIATSAGVSIWVLLWSFLGFRLGRDPGSLVVWLQVILLLVVTTVLGVALKATGRRRMRKE